MSNSESIRLSVAGREALLSGERVTIETWEPFGAGMCDVRVRFESGRILWTTLYTLQPTSGEPFPQRREICKMRNEESIAQNEKIRADLVEEIRSGRRWPGAEHGKAILGRAIDGALRDLRNER